MRVLAVLAAGLVAATLSSNPVRSDGSWLDAKNALAAQLRVVQDLGQPFPTEPPAGHIDAPLDRVRSDKHQHQMQRGCPVPWQTAC